MARCLVFARLEWDSGEKNLRLVSVGTGAAASPTFKTKMNLASNAIGLPGHLMYAIQLDQDINCQGSAHRPLSEDLGRAFFVDTI